MTNSSVDLIQSIKMFDEKYNDYTFTFTLYSLHTYDFSDAGIFVVVAAAAFFSIFRQDFIDGCAKVKQSYKIRGKTWRIPRIVWFEFHSCVICMVYFRL